MANTYDKAGADAASDSQVADYFRNIIANDPDVQAVIRRVWGNTTPDQRPSDTPKHLEQANDAASKEIARILQSKGIPLPERSFINPRSGQLEGHRGWSGLNGWQKAAIIAAGAATGVGAGLALAGSGAAAGAAGAGSGLGVTAGVPAGMAGVGATGVTAGAGLTGAGLAGTAGTVAGTGSVLSRVPDLLRKGGSALTAYADQSAANRGVAEGNQLVRDQVSRQSVSDYNNAVVDRARLDLEQRKAGADLQNNNFLNAIRSARILNWQPTARPNNVPTISFVGKGVGSQGMQASEEMNRQALLALLEGQKFNPLPEVERYTPAVAQKASTMEKVSNVLGPALAFYGMYKGAK